MNIVERIDTFMGHALKIAIIAFVAFIIILIIVVIVKIKGSPRKGTSKKLLAKGGLKYSRKPSGIVYGKDKRGFLCSPICEEQHVFVGSPSGLGKTAAVLIPTIRSFTNSGGHVLCLDISGDILSNCPEVNSTLVYEAENEFSTPYDVFRIIDSQSSKNAKYKHLIDLANQLMPLTKEMQSNPAAAFYFKNGLKILKACLITFYFRGFDFTEIMRKIVDTPYADLFSEIDKHADENAVRFINGFVGENPQHVAGAYGECCEAILFFATNSDVLANLRRPNKGEQSVHPERLESSNVFIIVEDAELEEYADLVHIIVEQHLAYFTRRENYSENKILFALDETSSFGKLRLKGALQKLRKKSVRIMLLCQSLVDLTDIYGKDTTYSMLNNMGHRIFLGAYDVDSMEYISKLVGTHEVTKNSTMQLAGSLGTHSTTTMKQRENIIEPVELAQLDDNILVVFPGGHALTKKYFYFEHETKKLEK